MAGTGDRGVIPGPAATGADPHPRDDGTARGRPRQMRIGRLGAWAILGTLGGLVAIVVPELGSDPWPFQPPAFHPHGVLGPLVRAAGRHWDLGFVWTPGIVAGFAVALVAVSGWRWRTWRSRCSRALSPGRVTFPATDRPRKLASLRPPDARRPTF